MRIVLLFVFFALASGFCDSITQTDWSGGGGISGPVLQLGNQFRYDTETAWYTVPGELRLWITSEHVVNNDFFLADDIYSEDIDGDGDRDILGSARYDYMISWFENVEDSGEVWFEHIIFYKEYWFTSSVFAVDIDSDGDVDLIGSASSYPDHLLAWWENDGTGSFTFEHAIDTVSAGVQSLIAVDMDGDLDIDITGAVEYNNQVAWWENVNGAGESWIKHIIATGFGGPRSACPVDIDGDGDLDMFAGSYNDDLFAWWENLDGAGGAWSETRYIAFNLECPQSVNACDLDGDGDMDVLGAATEAGCINWWENEDGQGGSWMEHQIIGDYYGATSVHTDDMDLDGDPDVIGAALFEDNVSWWENSDGVGTSWIIHEVDIRFDYVNDVYTDDFNGDGRPDILGSAGFDNQISWWDIGSYSPVGYIESSIFDTGCSPGWACIDWNSIEPSGTSIFFQYRASDDYISMGNWSEPILYPGVIDDLSYRYVQYLVTLETFCPDSTPVLCDLTISWDPLSIPDTTGLLPLLPPIQVNPNPASTPSIGFFLSEARHVSLYVFDVTGRLVFQMSDSCYPEGSYSVDLNELTPGIYICMMTSGDSISTQRFVVIE